MAILTKIRSSNIADSAITNTKIAADAVSAANIVAGAVAADVGASGITTALIAADAVTTEKIADGATTTLVCVTNSTTTVTHTTATLIVGTAVSGSGIPAGATIATIISNLSFTLSAAATTSVNPNTLTFNTGITSDKLAENLILSGSNVTFPVVTSANLPGAVGGTNASQTAVIGMLVYNSTFGVLQQYNAGGWVAIASPPTISSLTYPGSSTALDPAGGQTLIITGTNFLVGLTVTVDGTAPSATTRNSGTQVTITVPAKAAATYAAGLVVTNPDGADANFSVIYDALPAWTTPVGGDQTINSAATLGYFNDAVYTNANGPQIVAAESGDVITYQQVSDAGGATVITTGVQGLTLGTGLGSGVNSAANAGYLTGTLASAAYATIYNFYAKPTDAEGQIGAVRLFNIISSHKGVGGVVTTHGIYTVHSFITAYGQGGAGTNETFTAVGALGTVHFLIVAGGGGGGDAIAHYASGGGGAGGWDTGSRSMAAGDTYTIQVGIGGIGGNGGHGATATNGGNSFINGVNSNSGGNFNMTSTGGGAGGWSSGNEPDGDGRAGGSGGGAGAGSGHAGGAVAGSPSNRGNIGGAGGGPSQSGSTGGSGGGGDTDAGVGGSSSVGGAGGDGTANDYRTGSPVTYAGGGGGGSGYQPTAGISGGAGGAGGGGAGSPTGAGAAGSPNTGGGGGGARGSSVAGLNISNATAVGGTGIVVIRYIT